jgi:hypothetical protein
LKSRDLDIVQNRHGRHDRLRSRSQSITGPGVGAMAFREERLKEMIDLGHWKDLLIDIICPLVRPLYKHYAQ